MLRHPHCSTLFPYTTLFRSIFLGLAVALAGGMAWGVINGFLVAKAKIPAFVVTLGTLGDDEGGDLRDRKSTRLNSSHTVISYAVFCLKKKNKQSCMSARRCR